MIEYPVGNSLIPARTPLHVSQLILSFLKETFKTLGGDNYPFKYTDDYSTTGILFDTTYNPTSNVIGKKPLIVVSRGDASTAPSVTGDIGGASMLGRKSGQSSITNSSVVIKVISSASEEVDIISNELYKLLMACRTFLTKITPIHQVSNVSMSTISEVPQDDTFYMCVLSLGYVLQFKWNVDIHEETYDFTHELRASMQTQNTQL